MTPRPPGPTGRQGDPPAWPDPVRSPDPQGVPAEDPVWTAGDGLPVTPAITAYLRTVFLLREGGIPVPTMQIAQELGISGPSVTNMVKWLHELGLVRHERYHGVELTEAGERVALRATRLHRLLELYLVEALGFTWDEVHDEADRLMPHVSEKLETRLEAVLGHPTSDPHGDPIPTRDGVIAPVSDRRLLDLGAGAAATVARVADRDPARLRYLADLGLVPGAVVDVLEVLPFDGPLRVRVGSTERMVGRPLAAAVYVVGFEPGTKPTAAATYP